MKRPALVASVVVLALVVSKDATAASGLCTPFDLDTSNANVSQGYNPDGGPAKDITFCCNNGVECECRESKETVVGSPVDTLTGFAWLVRTDVHVAQPWGPSFRFTRRYATSAAQRGEAGARMGLGWSHTFATRLVLSVGTPAPQARLLMAEGPGEEFSLSSGKYTSLHGGRTLTWDGATQLYLAQRRDGTILVFDATGRLKAIRSNDGGETHLRYAGDDSACAVSATLPQGALCRVDFLFSRQLWFAYDGAGRLGSVSHDASGLRPAVRLEYDADGYLTRAVGADGNAESYTYGFQHIGWLTGTPVRLLLRATDADGKVVESFGYAFNHKASNGPARVVAHHTPEADYSFSWEYLDTASRTVVRKTHVRGTKENVDFTFADNVIASACYLDEEGHCDVSRMHTYTKQPGTFDILCEREGSGKYRRHERDSLGRVIAEYSGLTQCDAVTPEAKAHTEAYSYLGDTSVLAVTSFASLDATAPTGFVAFTVSDYTSPAVAVDPHCGTSVCQTPVAYNSGPLSTRVQQRVTVGRTLVGMDGTWGTQVKATKDSFDSASRLVGRDGPRRDAADVTTYSWNSSPGLEWARSSWMPAGRGPVQYADYDALGNAHTVTDEGGQVTRLDFDAKGRLTSHQPPGVSSPATLKYLPSGRLESRTAPTGAADSYVYDANGQLSEQRHLPSAVATLPDSVRAFVRSEKGVTKVTESELSPTSTSSPPSAVRQEGYGYDSQGRRTRTLSSGWSGGSAVGIDDDGRVAWLSDNGRFKPFDAQPVQSHHFTYDEWGNLQEVQQLMAGTWVKTAVFTWDTRGNLSTYTDAKGVTIRYQHDDFGRLVQVESPDFGRFRYLYDEADNLVKEVRPDGTALDFVYDAADRLLTVSQAGAVLERWTWGGVSAGVNDCASASALPPPLGAGRLTNVSDAAGEWYFGYWPDGKVRYESLVSKGGACGRTLSWEYDGSGRLTAMVYPSGARVEYGYPSPGTPLHDRASSLTLVAGGARTPLVTDIAWEAGEVVRCRAPPWPWDWQLSRGLDGLPRSVETPPAWSDMRSQDFSGFDGWGNPGSIEESLWGEKTAAQTHLFTHNDMPALMSAAGPGYVAQAYTYLASGDRKSSGGAASCYESGTHRLALVEDTSLFTYTKEGAVQRKYSKEGAITTWCYGPRGEVASTVGGGGEVSRLVTNFRRQRVAEAWPLNGLREDFRVDESSRLLVEAGVASLTSLYPRPVREYVWLGQHPVAVLESTEAQDGQTTHRGVTYLFSGQLGEVLMEANSSGQVLRQYEYAPFGERHEVSGVAGQTSVEVELTPLAAGPAGVWSQGRLSASGGARAMRLRFTGAAVAGCTVTLYDNASTQGAAPNLGRYTAVQQGDVTGWMPTAKLAIRVQDCAIAEGTQKWMLGVEVTTEAGVLSVTPHAEATSNPYPAGGQHFALSLTEPSYVHFDAVSLASCDGLEARDASGQALWRWAPGGFTVAGQWMPTDTEGFTGKLQGAVEFGIWGNGCNAAEAKAGFRVVEVLSESEVSFSSPPVAIGLPGQKFRYDGTVDNWNRHYDPKLGRYLSSEPMLEKPEFVRAAARMGLSPPTYAYALNNPVRYSDRDGLCVGPLAPVCAAICAGGACEAAAAAAAAALAAALAAAAGAYCGITGNCLPTSPPAPIAPPTPFPITPVVPPICTPKPIECELTGQLSLPGFGPCVYLCANGETVQVDSGGLPCEPTWVIYR
jgi:RHS repeat-associated protein